MAPLVALTTVHGSFTAHLLAARLEHEGIDVELRGAFGANYGLTVGDLARVDLYVPADQVDDARLVMLVAEIDEIDDHQGLQDLDAPPARSPGPAWPWVTALVLIVAAVVAPVLRYLAA